jgi:2-oxoglutarate ferredoxin oxidoreductase subunit alpha
MSEKVFMSGNLALAEGAIAGGCRYFFGYPITPQNEIPQYMAEQLPEIGGTYLQAESEVAAINMVYGAASTGAYVMTSSSSPGISLMQEGLSYIAGAELPCVVANLVRGGPGLGNIAPAQSDYWLATRGAGHGDSRCITFAPATVQELHDWAADAFEIAQKYRSIVMIQGDAVMAGLNEPVKLRERQEPPPRDQEWNIGGHRNGRERRIVNSLWTDAPVMQDVNMRMKERFERAADEYTLWDEYGSDEPEIVLGAYGISARICQTVVDWFDDEGITARLIRPISLFPFPTGVFAEWSEKVEKMFVVELSMGQFVEDVRLAVNGRCPVDLIWNTGGVLYTPEDVLRRIRDRM